MAITAMQIPPKDALQTGRMYRVFLKNGLVVFSSPGMQHMWACSLRAAEESVTALLPGVSLAHGAENKQGDGNGALNAEIWGWGEVGGGGMRVV